MYKDIRDLVEGVREKIGLEIGFRNEKVIYWKNGCNCTSPFLSLQMSLMPEFLSFLN